MWEFKVLKNIATYFFDECVRCGARELKAGVANSSGTSD